MKIYNMILFAIACILFVSSNNVRAERLSMKQVASVWKGNGGSSSSCATAVAVAWAESRGDTKARGQNSNSYDRGLWQINSYWHRDVSDRCAYDKNCNAKNAVRISSNGRKWSPWATYNDGLHKRWMNDAKKTCGGGVLWDETEEDVGGGRVYGEYNKGPYKAGAEYNWDEETNDDIGGGRVYGEYNKGPYKAGAEYNWDEETNDEMVGLSIRQPPHRPWEWEGGNGSPPYRPSSKFDEEEVGGGKVYGEYNKGPIKAGGEYTWDEQVGDASAFDMQATLQGFKKFDQKWHQFTTHQSIEKFTTPGNFVRRLRSVQAKTNLRKGRSLGFLGAFDALVSSVSGATGAVQGILNLFGKKSSESLVGQFQDRGFSHFNERTTVTVTSGLPTKYYEAFMKDMLKSVVKVPSKHNDAVNQIVRWGLYTGAKTWNAAENVFDIGKGGNAKNFQIFLNRNTQCEEMNIVLVKTDVAFKLAPDIFVISKSKSSWGGAFSSTKLHWKKNKAPIKQADISFVSEYFITLGMNRIKQSHEIGGMAQKEDGSCGGNAPPKQESPFRL